MIRQLGIPTWFFALSSADLQWPDVFQVVGSQYGEIITEEKIASMTYEERCAYIRRNPVTVTRHFDFKLSNFFLKFPNSDAKPVECIVHYFYKIEFQQRGLSNVHMLLWIKNAPRIGVREDKVVCDCVDKYV